MINLSVLFLILFWHWLADFVLQSDKDAKGKSTSNKSLLSHTLVYSMAWLPILSLNVIGALWFVLITFICHTAQDYITSREVKKYFDKQNFHNGFVVIGIDQFLHYVQLILCYYFLF